MEPAIAKGQIFERYGYFEVHDALTPELTLEVASLLFEKYSETATSLQFDRNENKRIQVALKNEHGYAFMTFGSYRRMGIDELTSDQYIAGFEKKISFFVAQDNFVGNILSSIRLEAKHNEPGIFELNGLTGTTYVNVETSDEKLQLSTQEMYIRQYSDSRELLEQRRPMLTVVRSILRGVGGNAIHPYEEMYGHLTDEQIVREKYERSPLETSLYIDSSRDAFIRIDSTQYLPSHQAIKSIATISSLAAEANSIRAELKKNVWNIDNLAQTLLNRQNMRNRS